ncbi:putative bifunctional diguanylate cyclase/phosphodiesterase [Marinobacterium sedimentorum]|uniref:putative bifunctional diguanylate cyclase/phosphodiesterase n=1 Tax=Marinobacterium sedimentorum TaxID=2927804 RepID=UPI0020C6E1D2|nr:EAL domain-containing protein [Marinobacterium sedimentorum]MCP8686436.1 EAL domain-containing protein [Marinobacterium sedimentorum]
MSIETLRALIVEDELNDTLLLVNELKRGGYNPSFICVDTREALESALQQEPWDIVFSDFSMPTFNGHDALDIVRRHNLDIPFIFVSGTIGEERAVAAIKQGAQDYLIKGHLKRLASAVERELREAVTRRENREAQKRLHFLANYDALTGLPNRVLFIDRLSHSLRVAQRSSGLVGVLYLDLDNFKDVNDSLGHNAGDALLKTVADRLTQAVRTSDTVARLSGDEFALILTNLDHREDAAVAARKIIDQLSHPLDVLEQTLQIRASVGISVFPADGTDSEELLRNADMSMYLAKQTGGSQYEFYRSEIGEKKAERLELLKALRRALEQREFVLHYQPQVELATGHIVGVEALLRWRCPERGLVSPEQFIPLAEESGLVVPLGEWVLRKACAQARIWRDTGYPPLRVAVNFSACQFRQKNLLDLVKTVLDENELPPEFLEVEITESTLMQDTAASLRTLQELRACGISISLDDFGTGYSSLSYLKRFPVDALKIDRSFVCDIPQDADDVAINSAIIAMAAKLNIRVIAEGVETLEQLDFLRSEGCALVQGYYLQRPASAQDLAAMLKNGQGDFF